MSGCSWLNWATSALPASIYSGPPQIMSQNWTSTLAWTEEAPSSVVAAVTARERMGRNFLMVFMGLSTVEFVGEAPENIQARRPWVNWGSMVECMGRIGGGQRSKITTRKHV